MALTTLNLNFTKQDGNVLVAEIPSVSSAITIHIQKEFKGDIVVEQKTCSNSFTGFDVEYCEVYTFKNVYSKEFDYDGAVFPKSVKVTCYGYTGGELPKACYSFETA